MTEETFDESIKRMVEFKPNNSDAALIARATRLARSPYALSRERAQPVWVNYEEGFGPPGEMREYTYTATVAVWNDNGTLRGEIVSKPKVLPDYLIETGATAGLGPQEKSDAATD